MFITLRILLGFCCLPICLAVYGQQKLCGYITDQVTGEVLVGATCYI